MKDGATNDREKIDAPNPGRNSIGTWIVVAVLSSLLVAAGVIGYLGWTIGDADVSTSGYIAMALGVIFSLVFGVGLMALIFYSSRKGYDEPAVLIEEPGVDLDDVRETRGENIKTP
jgi:hypothetical protein